MCEKLKGGHPIITHILKLEKEMAAHSSICIWRSPWTESLVGYSLWGCRVGQDWSNLACTHTYIKASYTFSYQWECENILRWMIKNVNVKKLIFFTIYWNQRNYLELSEKNVIRAKLIITVLFWNTCYHFNLYKK